LFVKIDKRRFKSAFYKVDWPLFYLVPDENAAVVKV